MKVRHKFAEGEAFEFNQNMVDKTEPVPNGVNVIWRKDFAIGKTEQSLEPMIEHNRNSSSILCAGCWIVKDTKTGETVVYYPLDRQMTGKENMLQDFMEVPDA